MYYFCVPLVKGYSCDFSVQICLNEIFKIKHIIHNPFWPNSIPSLLMMQADIPSN